MSADGWILEYFAKIAKHQIDAAIMLGMMPDTNNIHQAAISKALNQWQLHCNDKVVIKEGEKFRKVHSIQLPFQACNHFYDIHGNQVEECSFVWDKTKPGHTIALVGLQHRLKSPPPKKAETTGTMEIPESDCNLLGFSSTSETNSATGSSTNGSGISASNNAGASSSLGSGQNLSENAAHDVSFNP